MDGVAELDLTSPSLSSLVLDASEVWASVCLSRLPKMAELDIDCENIPNRLFEGLPILSFLTIGSKGMVRHLPPSPVSLDISPQNCLAKTTDCVPQCRLDQQPLRCSQATARCAPSLCTITAPRTLLQPLRIFQCCLNLPTLPSS